MLFQIGSGHGRGYQGEFSSKHLLNDVIAGQNDPIYKLLPTSVI